MRARWRWLRDNYDDYTCPSFVLMVVSFAGMVSGTVWLALSGC